MAGNFVHLQVFFCINAEVYEIEKRLRFVVKGCSKKTNFRTTLKILFLYHIQELAHLG